MNDTITVELIETSFYTRYPCHVCGGCTEKVSILAEAPNGLRVCERCLEDGHIDERLESHAKVLEDRVTAVRDLIGRLKVPSFAEWKARTEEYEREWPENYKRENPEYIEAKAEHALADGLPF